MSGSHPGQFVELRTSPLDWRDYLDNTAIHNGNVLEWWNGTTWQLVRYESAGRAPVRVNGRQPASISSYVTRPNRSASACAMCAAA